MSDYPAILEELAGRPGSRRLNKADAVMVRCPAHNDRTPSLLVSLTPAGGMAVKCFAGCKAADVRSALNLPAPSSNRRDNTDHHIATYEHPDGRRLEVFRRECAPGEICDYPQCAADTTKHIWQSRGRKAGAYALLWGEDDGISPIIWAEGEKAAAAIAQAGFMAVSTIGGTSIAGKADYSRLAGRELWFWPDQDGAGLKAAAEAAAKALADGVAAVYAVPPAGEQDSGDDAANLAPDTRRDWLNAAIADRETAPTKVNRQVAAVSAVQKPGPFSIEMPAPGYSTLSDADDVLRLLLTFGERIVVARSPESQIPDCLFVVNPDTGLLSCSDGDVMGLAILVGKDLLTAAYDAGLEPKEMNAVTGRAMWLKGKQAPAHLQFGLGGVLNADLQRGTGELLKMLEVKRHEDMDADMGCLGTPEGVLDLKAAQVLPAAEGRKHFITRSTGVRYRPRARHVDVDRVLPPPDKANGYIDFILRWIGWHLTHRTARDFLALIAEAGAGKTVLCNVLNAALGPYCVTIRQETLNKTGLEGAGSHNGAMMNYGGGVRLVLLKEVSTIKPEGLNLVTGGEDKVPVRMIYKAEVEVPVTAGTVVVGNIPTSGTMTAGAAIGLGGDDDVSRALRDRARFCGLPRREGKDLDPELLARTNPGTVSAAFREAALARLVQWAQLMADIPTPPESTPQMLADLERQAGREKPNWMTEFIPYVITQDPAIALIPDDEALAIKEPIIANSYAIYQEYHDWHEGKGVGKAAAQRAITDAAVKFHGLTVTNKGKVNRAQADPRKGMRVGTDFYEGWFMADPAKVVHLSISVDQNPQNKQKPTVEGVFLPNLPDTNGQMDKAAGGVPEVCNLHPGRVVMYDPAKGCRYCAEVERDG